MRGRKSRANSNAQGNHTTFNNMLAPLELNTMVTAMESGRGLTSGCGEGDRVQVKVKDKTREQAKRRIERN